jgi:hypothetical protein
MTVDTITYSFTTKLGRPENITKAVSIYKQTAESAKRFYKVILYTDVESAPLFEGIYDEIRIINTTGFVMVDDMKLAVLPLLSDNELLMDGDVYLRSPLIIPAGYDVLCDEGEPFDQSMQYIETMDLFMRLGISDVIPFYGGLKVVPNIGILKFQDSSTMNAYLYWHKMLRGWIIDKGLTDLTVRSRWRMSANTTVQYLLGAFIKSEYKRICYAKESNDYTHYKSNSKYREGFRIKP